MTQAAAAAAAVTASLVLLLAGFEHAAHPGKARAAVAAQRLLPSRLIATLVGALTALELGLGMTALVVVVLIGGGGPLLDSIILSVCLVYVSFTVYSLALLRWRPQAPCGCSTRLSPVSGRTILRSVTLAGLALAAVALDRPVTAGGPFETAVTLLAGGGFAVLLWHLPDAVVDPREILP